MLSAREITVGIRTATTVTVTTSLQRRSAELPRLPETGRFVIRLTDNTSDLRVTQIVAEYLRSTGLFRVNSTTGRNGEIHAYPIVRKPVPFFSAAGAARDASVKGL